MPFSPLEIANAYILAGELRDALDALDQHLADHPGDDDARRLRVQVTLRLTDAAAPLRALADLDALSTPLVDDILRRGQALEQLGQFDEAAAALRQGHNTFPDDERLIETLLHLLLRQQQTAEAGALLDGLPATWRWSQWRGDVAVIRGDLPAALDAYTTALAGVEAQFSASHLWAAGIRARLLLARASVLVDLGQYALAEADQRAAQAIIPDDPMIPFNLGLIAALQNRLDEALRLCGEALATAPSALRTSMTAALTTDSRFGSLAGLLTGSADG